MAEFLLKENGEFLLQENGSKILLQTTPAAPLTCFLILESTDRLLQEQADKFTLEGCDQIVIPPPVSQPGGTRAANPRALADAQLWREHLAADDEEILVLI